MDIYKYCHSRQQFKRFILGFQSLDIRGVTADIQTRNRGADFLNTSLVPYISK